MPVSGAETLGDLLSTDVWGVVHMNRGVWMEVALGALKEAVEVGRL
jgi:hypothetical protein